MRDAVRKYSLWWYYALSVAFVLTALLTVSWYMADRFRDFFVDQQRSELEIYSGAIRLDVENNGIPRTGIPHLCSTYGKTDKTLRVTVIDAEGQVQCDSVVNPVDMNNHRLRPEIITALQGMTGSSLRYSKTVKASMLYVAMPLKTDKGRLVLRVSRSLAAIDALLSEVFRKMLVVMVFLMAAIFLASLYLYRKINLPLYEIRRGAERYAGGNFDRMLPDYQVREISDLANAMNQMAARLDSLENLRQEFVANVSHELKTPVTTIKGFTETLIDGAMDDPEDLERFLGIISRQTDRLSNIIGDLLTLSRLESAPLSEVVALDWQNLCEILASCRDVCQARADKKSIRLHLHCIPPVRVRVDQSLLIQAVSNLIDNAIKYSPEQTTVKIVVGIEGQQVRIDVIDEGPGITELHIPRLFERFYRADKARSRKLGGTGLGLAIVKHITNVHQGEVEVSSRVGKGSTFTIWLPYSA